MTDELARYINGHAQTETSVLREEGRVLIRTSQVVTPLLEANKVAQSLYDPANERHNEGGFRLVARLDAVTVMQLNIAGIMQGAEVLDEKAFLKFIDDPDNRYLRTDNGRRLRNLPTKGHA